MKKKVLLILPPVILPAYGKVFITEPLGLAYVGAVLEEQGFEVKILDCILVRPGYEKLADGRKYYGLDYSTIKDEISEWGPEVVGISSMYTASHETTEQICRMIKKDISSEIVTICGGAHPTVAPEATLNDEHLDYVVLGEGEQAIRELMKTLDGSGELAGIDGIGYKAGGQVIVNTKTCFIQDLDALPYPGRHLLDM
ncbi:MAG: hypothetical protein GY869_04265, partial [Planctomycetes bacterium]|nr:hypothetical protein [Planctomycetota bacterium]